MASYSYNVYLFSYKLRCMHDNTFTAAHKDQKDNFHKHLNQQIIQYIKEVQEK